MDLDRFFSVGPDTPVAAQDVFTNRVSELEAFDAAVASMRLEDPRQAVVDTRAPRRNVLSCYGMGGIGKTRLSQELERRWLDSEDESRRAFRTDFAEGGASNLEGILVGLRATLGQYRPSWPAFDLAFSAYWERAHPGIPLQTMLNDSSPVRRVARDLEVGTQIQDAVEDLLDSPGGVLGIFVAGAKAIGRSVAERIRERRVLEECPLFRPVVDEPDPAKMRPYLAAMLAWDIAALKVADPLQLVVFFDTWERVQEHESRRGGVEDLLARVVHVMPNVLFVVTGRNRLRWSDPDLGATMQWGGPTSWPNLIPGAETEPRQHLVGDLSPQDAGRYLSQRLVKDGQAAIPADIRHTIVDAAEGLPLYLDLAATHFDEMVARGEEPTVEDFGHTLPEIVLRIMRDLDSDERSLLRAASLLHTFDEGLLRAGLPGVTDACLARFLQRAFIGRRQDTWLPYSLHETVRGAIRAGDVSDDSWSEREWLVTVDRLLEELHRRTEPELSASGSVDVPELIGSFMEAFRLSVVRSEAPTWVVQAAARLQTLSELAVLAWTDSYVDPGHPLYPLARGIAAVGRRGEKGLEATRDELQASLEDDRLDHAGRDFVTIWLSWMLDGLEQRDEARQLRLRIASHDGPFAAHARHAVGRSDWVEGRLRQCLSWEFDDGDPLQRFWRTGLHGRVDWILGRFDEAELTLAHRLDAARDIGSVELEAHALRTLGESRCWSAPEAGDDESRQAVEIYRRFGNRISAGEAMTSSAITEIGRAHPGTIIERIAEARQEMRGGGYADVAETFLHCAVGDLDTARASRQRVLDARSGRAYGFWNAITGWWVADVSGEDEPELEPEVEWLRGYDDARGRWVEVLRRRREQM